MPKIAIPKEQIEAYLRYVGRIQAGWPVQWIQAQRIYKRKKNVFKGIGWVGWFTIGYDRNATKRDFIVTDQELQNIE